MTLSLPSIVIRTDIAKERKGDSEPILATSDWVK